MLYECSLAFQALLYKQPLFEFIGRTEQNMNVLVIGWDSAVECFVDQCLQAGQMDSHSLIVTVLTASPNEAKARYLEARPDLDKFVNVNGSLDNKDVEVYAVLNFVEFSMEQDLKSADLDAREEILLDILAEAPDERYHYFIVSLGADEVNRIAALGLKSAVDELMPSEENAIHYVTKEETASDPDFGIVPVCITGLQQVSDIDPELERMAFNAHLSWADSVNGDCIAEYERFKADSYNYLSSTALALSLKYKLADLGIKMDDYDIAAQAFWKAIQDEKNAETLNKVIALEHRRWVLNLCTAGWTAPSEEKRQKYYDDCIERCSVKDKENKIHPCIVRSTVDTPLSTGIFSCDRIAWDIKSAANDSQLDELDRMSVELHRRMLSRANAYAKKNPLEREEVLEISERFHQENINERTNREWERFQFCLKNILDGSWSYSKQYDLYKERFLKILKDCSDACRNYVEERIESLSRKFWPVIECNLYRDYKKYDEILVRKIPFILTYQVGLSLATAFRTTGSLNTMNDIMFKNVASATVIKPGRITYLLFLDDTACREVIRQMIQMVVKYMNGKGINCRIDFLAAGLESVHEEKKETWKKCFDGLVKKGCINDYRLQFVDKEQDAVDFWAEALSKVKIDLFDGTTNLFQSMQANSELLKVVQDRFPYFEFDSRNKRFKNNQRCQYLSYIEDHTYLGIEEMFGLAGAEDMEFNYPVLGREYKNLWNIYIGKNRGNKARWKENIRYAVKCWNVMCDTLENYDENHPDAKEVDMTILADSYKGYQKWNDILSIIRELSGEQGGKQYLIPRKENGKMVSFRYSDKDVKGVLTKAGDILEIYTYFTVCEQGWFDEAACGYRFRWEEDQINNELDLVLTKGFQSLIIECKARSKLDQNFYFKLNSLVDMFGIGAHKVLLTTAKTDEGDNKMQQERGNMMGITTISEIEDIQGIAERFMKML